MKSFNTITYDVDGKVARITLNRPERGNGITLEMPEEIASAVEHANLDPDVHVITLSGNGKGFCSGYDLVIAAEHRTQGLVEPNRWPQDSPMDIDVQLANHDPDKTWDPLLDYAMMSRNVRNFMSLFYSDKPVLCKVHGFCVAGGTDLALCSDLIVIEDEARIGYPPARVWGTPTTALWAFRIGVERAKRLLLTGDCLTGTQAVAWGLATEAPPAEQLDERFEMLVERVARLPINQLITMKLLINQTMLNQGLQSTQVLATIFDGISRHTKEGYDFQKRAAEVGFKQAVRERDEAFGDGLVPPLES